VVGESGCGKSVTALSVLRLVRPPGPHRARQPHPVRGQDLLAAPERELRRVRATAWR
jgi:peptide/nickel transport system ATP-binding protein